MASDTVYHDFNGLESCMRGQSTLGGYDVLVSYAEGELNALFKAATEKDDIASIPVPEFTTSVPNGFGSNDVTNYRMNLVLIDPNFKFAGAISSPDILLSFAIKGHVSRQGADGKWGAAEPVPLGMRLVITSLLSLVTGTVHENFPNSGFVPVSPPSNPGGDSTVQFDSSKNQTSAIVIYIPREDAHAGQVNIESDSSGSSVDQAPFMNVLIQSYMEAYFRDRPWNYYLALVSNETALAPKINDCYMLRPTSFGFSISPGNTQGKIDNTICMWMTVLGGSKEAILQSGAPCNQQFRDHGKLCRPIPIGKGSSASIIFSHDLMRSVLFKEIFIASGCSDVKAADDSNAGGIKMNFNLPSIVIHKDGLRKTEDSVTVILDPINFNLKDYQATLQLQPGLSVIDKPVGHLTWTSKKIKLAWSRITEIIAGRRRFNESTSGATDMVFSFEGSGSWDNPGPSDPDSVRFSWKLPSNLKVTFSAEKDSLSFWQGVFGSNWQQHVPTYYREISVSLPNLDFLNSTVNYFLTTNVLLPGENIFIADPLRAANDSAGIGIAVPYDVLLTGKVNQNATAAAASNRVPLFFALSRQPAISPTVPPTLSTENLAVGFVQSIFTCPQDSLVGPLMSTAAGPGDAANKVRSILQHHGYGDLPADELLAVLGTSTAEILGPGAVVQHANEDTGAEGVETLANALNALTSPATRSATASAFDVRVFAGSFDITEGPDMIKQQGLLTINLSDGSITLGGESVFPKTSTNSNARSTVSWNTEKASYAVVFKSFPDHNNRFVASFAGTVSLPGESPAAFAGRASLKGSSEKEEVTNTTANQEANSMVNASYIPEDDMQTLDLVNTFFGIAGFLGCVATVIWRRRDMRTQEIATRAQRIANEQIADMHQRIQRMDSFLQFRADDAIQKEVDEHRIPWKEFQGQMTTKIEGDIETHLREISLEDLKTMQREAGGDQWNSIKTEGSLAVRNAVNSVFAEAGEAPVIDKLFRFINAGYISDSAAKEMFKTACREDVQRRVEALTSGSDASSYLDLTIKSLVTKRILHLSQQELELATQEAAQLGSVERQTSGQLQEKKEKSDMLARQLSQSDISGAERTNLSLQQTILQTEIDRLDQKRQSDEQNAREMEEKRSRIKAEHDEAARSQEGQTEKRDAADKMKEALGE